MNHTHTAALTDFALYPLTVAGGAFDARKTFECGQCFRFDFRPELNVWAGVADGRYAEVSADASSIFCGSGDLGFWRRFLALDEDYAALDDKIRSAMPDETTAAAVKTGAGIRLLRQDGWEALCSFIVSQNNNIPRIKKIIAALCERYGEPFLTPRGVMRRFPTPSALADAGEDAIFSLRTGFRAKYIADAAEKVASGVINLADIAEMPLSEASAELCKIKGVGPKVASCALLYGMGRTEAFPVDVWIKRTLGKYYGGAVDLASLGGAAGLFQQYLFYYERTRGDNSFDN